jgi:hypothetical protein
VAWHENDGATPPGWTIHTIASDRDGAISVCAADLDADGDMDVVAGAWWDSKVVWYESDGGMLPSFTAHEIGICGGPEALFVAHVDAGPDLDVLCAANAANKVFFFENVPNPTTGVPEGARASFTLHGVSPNPSHGPMRVRFSLADHRPARIEVMDVAGRRVISREVGEMGPGEHEVRLETRLSAGLYLVRLRQDHSTRGVRTVVVE